MPVQALWDVAAPAKLNLFLHVVGRRPDGYHLLQSAFVLIDWCDTLHFELRRDSRLERHDLGTPLPGDDLCLRAARALQSASQCAWGCDISIDKQIPSGAGMGGGSSDAATTLLALNRLWGLNWPRDRLQALALPLGADVPFFVGGENAWVEGIGERITPIAVRPHRLVVVKPPCNIPTSAIFSSPDLVRDNEPAILLGFPAREVKNAAAENAAKQASGEDAAGVSQAAADRWSTDELFHGFGRNDLQPVAEAGFPEVVQALKLLRDEFGNSRMTGSGSAVFAHWPDQAVGSEDCGAGTHAASAVASQGGEQPPAWLEKLPADWVARVCRSLEHHPLRDWATGH